MKKIGIIGSSGRMGLLLSQAIKTDNFYHLGKDYNKGSKYKLQEVFIDNDFIIDFSSLDLIKDIISEALKNPKPIAICTTGWKQNNFKKELETLAEKVPIVIASNTSLGANLQRYLVSLLSKMLDASYDIDITEKHHRNKVDIPSGTAASLINEIKKAKKEHFDIDYSSNPPEHGPRPENFIGVHVERSGNLPGEHEVVFTSNSELISVKHIAFERKLFALGAIRIIKWFDQHQPKPSIYSMKNVLEFNRDKNVK
ncbi:MAG: 4-hydroxy-tetrahydrodipicolinate reductase [Candidatus Midichloria sp.]|uniref:4-hydroxy-tetrahydrodipicolinate reductase n=1 Tax=Hyalomma marginatum TaxID=34627 RepID=A0A8S4BXI9_9ACAR|nr:4-hydroxy-tetrahydrodipicolinate reductase [Hyalomma marginatum]CAG7600286.1 4-hydroxy-tetrahydrodipicolinate reductase [Hyalomma marginatum]